MRDNTALIERVRGGDKQAENTMVENNIGLVYSVAGRFSNRGYDNEDLVQIGAIGLIKAIKNFNPEFNVQFSTYAVPMISGEIKRFLRDDGTIRISRRLKEKAMKGRMCEEFLRRKLNREPTINEISEESGIESETLIAAFEASAPTESIYETVYSDSEKDICLIDTLVGDEIEEKVINRVMLDEMLSILTKREKEVILLRYFRGKTQMEVAKVIGVSQVQISRIEKQAVEKMRKKMI